MLTCTFRTKRGVCDRPAVAEYRKRCYPRAVVFRCAEHDKGRSVRDWVRRPVAP